MGIPLPVIGALLILTLSVFFTGFLPYPIGWVILSVAIRWPMAPPQSPMRTCGSSRPRRIRKASAALSGRRH